MDSDNVPRRVHASVRAHTQFAGACAGGVRWHTDVARRTGYGRGMAERIHTAGSRRGRFPVALLLCLVAAMPMAQAQDAAALWARHATLHESLARNAFGRPLHLESSEASGELNGEVYARVAHPFAVAGPALRAIGHWCDILILHPNIKGCVATGATLNVRVGRKSEQALDDAYPVAFRYEVAASRADYLRVVLDAPRGPLGTRRYRIVLEAAPLEGGSTFLHLSYGYVHGAASRWATHAYLATVARAKVGFSVVGTTAQGKPVYIGGTRGMVERNAMRCYLAIEAYLGALSAPAKEQAERRLRGWHDAAERYAPQLRDLELGEYLAMKRKEIRAQQGPAVSSSAQTRAMPGATLDSP